MLTMLLCHVQQERLVHSLERVVVALCPRLVELEPYVKDGQTTQG